MDEVKKSMDDGANSFDKQLTQVQEKANLVAMLGAHKTFLSVAFIVTLCIQFFLLGDMSFIAKCVVLIISAFAMVMFCAVMLKNAVLKLLLKFSPTSVLYAVTVIAAIIVLLLTVVFVALF